MQPYNSNVGLLNTQKTGLSSTPYGGLLCGALLKAYEGASANLMNERWLVGKSLSLLLASSTSAKQTGLKGEVTLNGFTPASGFCPEWSQWWLLKL